ncbi:MAG: hypothetical protein R3B70_00010 [Polyangiaceae bacterium]
MVLLAGVLSAGVAAAEEPGEGSPASSEADVDATVKSLLYDVRKIVEVQTSTGWKIDRYEYEKMMPDTLLSVCRTTDETRGFALAEAGREVTRLGGSLETALEKNGNRIDELNELLFATRVEKLLGEAIRRAPSECPLWVKPQRDFRSVQAGVDRFFLAAEGGGAGMLQYAEDHPEGTTGVTLGGGGGGRLLLGRGFGSNWSVRFGPELSGVALVQRDGETTSLPLQFQGALPIVVRYTDISWHYNGEVAPLAMFTENDPVLRYGFRVGAMIGITALQVRSFIPWAGVGGQVELFPESDGRTLLVNLKGGLRAGVDWDF